MRCRNDRLVGAEQGARSDAEQERVTDLAGGAGHGDANGWRLIMGRQKTSAVWDRFGWRQVQNGRGGRAERGERDKRGERGWASGPASRFFEPIPTQLLRLVSTNPS